MHLRGMNPYVASALADWQAKLRLRPAVPLGSAPRSSAGDLVTSSGAPLALGAAGCCGIVPSLVSSLQEQQQLHSPHAVLQQSKRPVQAPAHSA